MASCQDFSRAADFALEAFDLVAVHYSFFVQSLALVALPLDAGMQVGGLLGQNFDLFLVIAQAGCRSGRCDSRRAGQFVLGDGSAALERGQLLAQFAQFAFAGQDAGRPRKRADRHRAVRLEQLTRERDEAKALGMFGKLPAPGQIAHDQRPAQKLGRQVGQLGMLAGDQLHGRGHKSGLVRRRAASCPAPVSRLSSDTSIKAIGTQRGERGVLLVGRRRHAVAES